MRQGGQQHLLIMTSKSKTASIPRQNQQRGPPTPSSPRECCSPLLGPRGSHTRLGGGVAGNQFRRWDRHSGTLGVLWFSSLYTLHRQNIGIYTPPPPPPLPAIRRQADAKIKRLNFPGYHSNFSSLVRGNISIFLGYLVTG
jgi:hypothetical protein